jgi:DNA-binding transcriptional LysR family regulator
MPRSPSCSKPAASPTEGVGLIATLQGGYRLAQTARDMRPIEAVCHSVAAGVDVSVLPDAAAKRWQTTHPVATVPLSNDWAARQLLLCTHPTTTPSAPAEALRAHLTNRGRTAPAGPIPALQAQSVAEWPPNGPGPVAEGR